MAFTDANESLPVRTELNGDVAAKIVDGTTTSQALGVDSGGRITVKLDDGSGTPVTSQANGSQRALDVGIDVAGVQIDPRQVRALTSVDVVTAAQGAPNTVANGWPVKITDGTNTAAVTATGEQKVSVTQPLPAGTNLIGSVDIKDSSGNSIGSTSGALNVAVTQPLPAGTNVIGEVKADIQVGASPVSASNPVPVYMNEAPGTEVINYDQGAATGSGAATNHIYTVTTGKTLRLKRINASSSGKSRLEIQVSQDGTTFSTVGVIRTTVAEMNVFFQFEEPMDVASAGKVKIIKTNQDKQAEDIDSTIIGLEQ